MKLRFWRRLLVSTLLMLIALSATAGLGIWQYTAAYRNDVVNEVAQRPVVDFSEVSTLGEYLFETDYGQLVSVSGELDCSKSVDVTFDQQRPTWIVCPMYLEDSTVVAVAFQSLSATEVGAYQITGRIQPAQSTSELSPRYFLGPSVIDLNTDELAMRWQRDVHDGYVAAIKTDPTVESEIIDAGLYVWPPVGIQMRNLFYAWQWWIFAAFTLFIWAKFTWDDYRALRDSEMIEANLDVRS
jgi:cytochrome oxidase assembly protein ShyY1